MTNITNVLPENPVAKIIIDGLFILCVNEQTQKAEVWIYEYANEHDFFIRVSMKTHIDPSDPGKGGQLVKKLEGEKEISTGNLVIAVVNSQPNLSCFQYDFVPEGLFTKDPKDLHEFETIISPHSLDFRWIIDIEGERFHKEKLNIIAGVVFRKITIPNGLLYTHRLVGREIDRAYPATKLPCDKPPVETVRYYVTNQLGIAIDQLKENEVLSIFYRSEDDLPCTLPLATPPPSQSINDELYSCYYEIYISNNCPSSNTEVDNERRIIQSDFQHYYNVINLSAPERLELKTTFGAGHRITPCDLIYLGGTPEMPTSEAS